MLLPFLFKKVKFPHKRRRHISETENLEEKQGGRIRE